jgi:hypothetical protein
MHFITSKINLGNVFSLEGDVNSGLEILTIAVIVGSSWNKTYEIAMRAVQAKDPNAWKFDHTELFANFDAFISRCGDLNEICQNTIQAHGSVEQHLFQFRSHPGHSARQLLEVFRKSRIRTLEFSRSLRLLTATYSTFRTIARTLDSMNTAHPARISSHCY